MAQTASAQAVVLGQGVLPPVKLGAFKGPSSGGWREESPQARCSVVRRFKSIRCLISLQWQAAQETPLQWKATFTEVLFASEPDPRAALAVVWEVLWLPRRQAAQQLCFPMVL